MEKIKELQSKVTRLYNLVYQHKCNDCSITFQYDANSLTDIISEIKRDVDELEKIQNYNNASANTSTKEMVNHPSHYKNSQFECIDVMLDVFGKEKVSAFCELNAFKYQWRSHNKGTDIQDKEKAVWYLNKYITLKENK